MQFHGTTAPEAGFSPADGMRLGSAMQLNQAVATAAKKLRKGIDKAGAENVARALKKQKPAYILNSRQDEWDLLPAAEHLRVAAQFGLTHDGHERHPDYLPGR